MTLEVLTMSLMVLMTTLEVLTMALKTQAMLGTSQSWVDCFVWMVPVVGIPHQMATGVVYSVVFLLVQPEAG